MADNVTLNLGTGGDVIAADDDGAAKHQYVKLEFGADNTQTKVQASAPLPVQVGDGTDAALVTAGGALLVDASGVTVPISNAGITTIAGAVAGTEMQVDVLTMPSVAVTNAGTFATQVDGAALTALQLIDDPVATLGTTTYTETTTKGMIVGAVRRDADTTLVDTTNEVGPLQMDANGRLKVEAFSGEALPVTDNGGNISIDWAGTVPPIGAGTEAAALRVTLATDSTGVVSVDDNGASLSVDWNGTQPVTGSGNATGALRVELANNGTGVLSTVGTITNAVTVVGGAAHASPVSGNPNLVAGRASNAVPTDVGADGDAASLWTNRNGALVVTMAPHLGLFGSPWTLTGETAQYTTTQTSTVLVAGGASERLVVTAVQIQVGGTTAGTLQLYFGTGAYSRGTNLAIFDGEFAPSSTLKPGVIMQGPFISAANGDDLLVTTSAAINPLTITVWYYVVT